MPHHALRAHPLALALAAFIVPAAFTPAHAAEEPEAADKQPRKELERVEVVGKYQDKPSSVKYTEELRDTPQTITVVNREVMEEQNLLGLRDVLGTLPGITFGAGEGGGGFGDSITLRGFTASSDITTDGVRDSAQYSRTDSFNLEAIELVNGANSVYSGAGSVGGSINLVSKAARAGTFNTAQLGVGTDGYARLTADSNLEIGDNAAFRINAMAHANDAPGRDVEEFARWGVAPSIVLGLGTETRLTFSYFHQTDNNIPQYGVPYYSDFGGMLPGAKTENYYGYSNVDSQDIDVDMLTGVLEVDFSENTTLRSLARFQTVDQVSVASAPQGTWCLDSGVNPSPTAGPNCLSGQQPGTFLPGQPSGPRGFRRDTDNSILVSQTDLVSHFDTGAIEHAVVAGVSFSHEEFDLDTRQTLRGPNGEIPAFPPMSIEDPDHVYTGPRNFIRQNITQGSLDTAAVYAFDTLKFDEHWMLNLGARWETTEGTSIVDTYGVSGATLGTVTQHDAFETEDDLFSYRAALLFKPVDAGTVYLAYSNSKTPSKANVNGTCNAQTCNVDPETAVNIELGTKWDLSDRLALNAAVFRNDREEYKVADPGNPANPSGEQQLDGEARVEGVAIGIAGQITHEWSVFANATFLDSEVLQGVSDFVAGSGGDPLAGRDLSGTPERSGSVWTTYDLERWTFGYGISYQSDYVFYSASGANYGRIPGYTTHRAMIGYDVNDRLSLQLNANNLFDKEYFIRVRNNGWATPGDAQAFTLTATYRF